MEKIGLIAGNGTFPVLFAREARRRGYSVVAVAHRDETDPALEPEVDELVWVRVGQLGKMLRTFERAGVTRAAMAGGIDKVRQLTDVRPDVRGALFLGRAAAAARQGAMGDDALLRALADEFERRGVHIEPSTVFLESLTAPSGHFAGPVPSEEARADIELGASVLAALGPMDVGQSVVVERGVVLAVEAVEGTDATVTRGGNLGRGDAVVVKLAKCGQDMRFDVPAVGPRTIEVMASAGARTLAVQAGATLVLDSERLASLAAEHGIGCIGCDAVGRGDDAAQSPTDSEPGDD